MRVQVPKSPVERVLSIPAWLRQECLPSQDLIETRNASLDDLDELVRMEREAWPMDLCASSELIEKRLKINPTCTLIATSSLLKAPVAFCVLVPLVSWTNHDHTAWNYYHALSLDGDYHRKLESPDTFYAVSITSVPAASRGTGAALMAAACEWGELQGAEKLSYVIRIPGFRHYAEHGVSIEAYYAGLLSGQYQEPAFSMARNAGGRPTGVLSRFYDDPDSLNYGVKIVHAL